MPARCPLAACPGDRTDEEARKQQALLVAFDDLKKKWWADPKHMDKTEDHLPWQFHGFSPRGGYALFVYTESHNWPDGPKTTHVPLDVRNLGRYLKKNKPNRSNKRPVGAGTSDTTGAGQSKQPRADVAGPD